MVGVPVVISLLMKTWFKTKFFAYISSYMICKRLRLILMIQKFGLISHQEVVIKIRRNKMMSNNYHLFSPSVLWRMQVCDVEVGRLMPQNFGGKEQRFPLAIFPVFVNHIDCQHDFQNLETDDFSSRYHTFLHQLGLLSPKTNKNVLMNKENVESTSINLNIFFSEIFSV